MGLFYLPLRKIGAYPVVYSDYTGIIYNFDFLHNNNLKMKYCYTSTCILVYMCAFYIQLSEKQNFIVDIQQKHHICQCFNFYLKDDSNVKNV